MDLKEEGEIESDEGEIYNAVKRPTEARTIISSEKYNSDSSENSESDGEVPRRKFLKRPPVATSTSSASSRSKNGHLWRNMLQEETLMENLKTCDVSTRKRKFERGAESYDFENVALVNHRTHVDHDTDRSKYLKRRRMDISCNEDSSSSSSSTRANKRVKKNRPCNFKRFSKILQDLTETLESSDEDFGRDLSDKLEEEKCDLIVKAVTIIGKTASMKLFKITQKIEREGGMLTMNKTRRRTPGGVFLFLLKTSDTIGEGLKKEIFQNDKKTTDGRKMSSEQLARDPPNSPANPELLENGKLLTDPDLVSQKILSFKSSPRDDKLRDLDDEMDTF